MTADWRKIERSVERWFIDEGYSIERNTDLLAIDDDATAINVSRLAKAIADDLSPPA